MKLLLALVPCALLWLATPLHAGTILVSASTSGMNTGSYHNRDTKNSQFYDDSLVKDQGGSSTLTVSSHNGKANFADQAQIEGSVTGTATVAPSSADFTAFTYTASAGTGSGIDNPRTDYSETNQLDYTGTFTVSSETAYTLTISGSASTSSTYSLALDSAKSIANLKDSKGDVLGAYESLSSNNGTTTSDTGPISVSGILAPGTYTIFAETYLSSGSSGHGISSESASLSYQLELSPVTTPEPASLTLLGLGACSLLGYGWRRRKQAASA